MLPNVTLPHRRHVSKQEIVLFIATFTNENTQVNETSHINQRLKILTEHSWSKKG